LGNDKDLGISNTINRNTSQLYQAAINKARDEVNEQFR
jgi:hypothetical protein